MKELEKQIRYGLEKKKMSVGEFIDKVGFTTPAYYKMLKANSTTEERLNKINEILGLNLRKEKTNEIYDSNSTKKVESTNEIDTILEKYKSEWNTEKEAMQYRINILTDTIKNLSLGKFRGIYFTLNT